MSLIEVIVGVALIGVVGGVVAAVLINAWATQSAVTGMTAATTKGNLVSAQIERALRTAHVVEISDAGDTLRLETSLPGDRTCQGYAIVDGDLRFAERADTLPPRESWALWHEGVGGVAGAAVFHVDGSSVVYGFEFGGSDAVVAVHGRAAPRAATGGSTSCW